MQPFKLMFFIVTVHYNIKYKIMVKLIELKAKPSEPPFKNKNNFV